MATADKHFGRTSRKFKAARNSVSCSLKLKMIPVPSRSGVIYLQQQQAFWAQQDQQIFLCRPNSIYLSQNTLAHVLSSVFLSN